MFKTMVDAVGTFDLQVVLLVILSIYSIMVQRSLHVPLKVFFLLKDEGHSWHSRCTNIAFGSFTISF